MMEKIQLYTRAVIDLLFPPRMQETLIRSITKETLLHLPKAKMNTPNVYSLFSYKDIQVKALVWELKYHRNPHAIELVGALLAEYLTEELSDMTLFNNIPTILIPIPVTQKCLQKRGFSQTHLLCEEIQKHIAQKVFYEPNALEKTKETEKQSKTHSKVERLKNLEGSFEANNQKVSGKNVILIDDVTTTGATISEATKALKSAGAKHICTFTVAH